MKSRSKLYLYAGFGASVAALVIYLSVSQPDNQKPAPAPKHSTAIAAPKANPTEGSLPVASVEKTLPKPSEPSTGSPAAISANPPPTSSPAQLAANEEKPAPDNPSTASASVAGSTSLPPESIATRRMYMAHASLRTPEVSNPDSETNRRILQTMVTKALGRAPTSPQSSSPSK